MSARTRALAVAIAVCIALLAVPAAAVDREVLIDQATVNGGGITPGDTAGFPALLSRPGRYKLSGNLAVPAEKNGIEVTRHDVTIDLNGFTISSNPPGEASNAVYAGSMTGLRVMNGTITGFGNAAISNLEGAFALVEDMRIVSNRRGVLVYGDSRIHNNTIAGGDLGIVCDDYPDPCLIEQNVVTGTQQFGVLADVAVVLGNAIVFNDGYALWAPSGGYGGNILFDNWEQGSAGPLHPNFCDSACP